MRRKDLSIGLVAAVGILGALQVVSMPLAAAKGAAKPTAKAGAGGASATAMAQFKAKQYGLAAESFRKAIAADRANSTLYYYYALSLHYSGNVNGAKAIYNQIMQYFPNTDAAQRAQMAMGAMGTPVAAAAPSMASTPSVVQRMMEPPGERNGEIIGPDECVLRFERVNNALIFDAKVNDRPIKVVFDTGAEMCAFGKNHFAEMRLPVPTGRPTGYSQGVGDGGAQATWDAIVSLTIGPITRKHFPVSIQDNLDTQPLLGQTFFQDFTYTIDNGASTIHMRRKNKGGGSIYSQSNDPNAVPFTRMGNEIIVNATINGRTCPVIFDTGAMTCAFTAGQVAQLGLKVPEDARPGRSIGVGGETNTLSFPVTTMKLGPIEKRDFEISVLEKALMPHPLLGQSFYGDWQFTIDYDKKLIHFLRR